MAEHIITEDDGLVLVPWGELSATQEQGAIPFLMAHFQSVGLEITPQMLEQPGTQNISVILSGDEILGVKED